MTLPFNPPDAPCKGATHLFFQDSRGDSTTSNVAKAICQTCPHIQPCLDYALDNDEQHGIWGGMSIRQRRKHAGKHRPPNARVAVCGTTGGNMAHRKRHEPPCDPCRAAWNDYKRNRRNSRPSRATGDAA